MRLFSVVQRGDPVRLRCALFAPTSRRERLLALYAFNLELAKISSLVSEPMLGEIRLQWWREALDEAYGEGPVRAHEVAQPLGEVVREAGLPRNLLDGMIDARGAELDPAFPSDFSALSNYLDATGGALTEAAALALSPLGEGERAVARAAGLAIAVSRYLAAIPVLRSRGKRSLPAKTAASLDDASVDDDGENSLREIGLNAAAQARRGRRNVPRAALPALLELPLAERRIRSGALEPMPERLPFSVILRGLAGRW